MKGRTRLWLLVSFAVLLFLIVGSGVVFVLLRSHPTSSSPQTRIAWKAATTDFTQQDQQAIEKLVQDSLATQAKNIPRPSELDIIIAKREGDWATFNTQQKAANGEILSTEPGFFIAQKQGTAWVLYLPGTPNFCDQLDQVPDALFAPEDKQYFCQS